MKRSVYLILVIVGFGCQQKPATSIVSGVVEVKKTEWIKVDTIDIAAFNSDPL